MSELEFILELKNMQNIEPIDRVLDYVFNFINDMLLQRNFNLCNDLLKSIKVDEYDMDILIGILTITAPWCSKLKKRNDFYLNVEKHLLETLDKGRVKSILIEK